MNKVLLLAALILSVIILSGCSTPKTHREGCGQDPVKLAPLYRTRTVLVMCDDGMMRYTEVPYETIR